MGTMQRSRRTNARRSFAADRPPMLLVVALAALVIGCANREVTTTPSGGAKSPPSVQVTTSPGPKETVDSFLQAARAGNGQDMLALLASGLRGKNSAKDLSEGIPSHYPAGTSWEVLKEETHGAVSDVIVEFKGAQVDPNPFRFTLTREGDVWRITHAPDVKEGGGGIKIKL